MSGVTVADILSTCPAATIAPVPGVPHNMLTTPPAAPADLVLLSADLSDPSSEGLTDAGMETDAPAETEADVGEAAAADVEADLGAQAAAGTETNAAADAAADVEAVVAAALLVAGGW